MKNLYKIDDLFQKENANNEGNVIKKDKNFDQ